MTRTYTYLLTYLLTLHGANHTVPSTPGPLTGAYTYLLTYLHCRELHLMPPAISLSPTPGWDSFIR